LTIEHPLQIGAVVI